MRKHGWLLAALALAGAGCHKGSDAKAQADEQAQSEDSEGQGSAPEQPATPTEPEKPVAITSAMIDKYIAYQDAALKAYQDTLARVQKLDAKADAGAYNGALGGIAGMRDGLDLLKKQQEAEEKARAQSGLTEREIEQVRAVVGEVINRRQLMATLHLDEQIQQFEKMRDQLPADQRGQMDQTIQSLKQQQEENSKLTDARKQFGDANVDAVLAREKDLTDAYQRWLKAFSGKK